MTSLFFMTSTKSSRTLFYKEPVYKQLAIQWQIAKQLSGLNLKYNNNYRNNKATIKTTDSKKMELFLCNKRKTVAKLTIHQNSDFSKALLGEFSNHLPWISILNSGNCFLPRRHRLLNQTTKQPLSNFEGWKKV